MDPEPQETAPNLGEPRETNLSDWYSGLHPFTVDIVGDFAGRQLFVVHGDAVVRHILAKQQIDLTNGFQLLHAVYEVEKFLQALVARKCNFHVVFFRSFAALCTPSQPSQDQFRFGLVRAVIVEHLTRCLWLKPASDVIPITIHQFDTPDCSAFNHYLDANPVNFFLVDNGGHSALNSETSIVWCQSFMYRLMSRGYHLAFVNEMQAISSKVMVPLVRSSGSGLPPLDLVEPPITAEDGDDEARHEELLQFLTEAQQVPDFSKVTFRDAVLALALKDFVQSHSWEGVMTDLFAVVLQSAILNICSLSERSCWKNESSVSTDKAEFLHELCRLATGFVRGCASLVVPNSVAWNVCDLIDGRVYFSVLAKLKAREALPMILDKEGANLLAFFVPPSHLALARERWAEIDFSKKGFHMQDLSCAESIPTSLAFAHPVFTEYFRDIKLNETTDPKYGTTSTVLEELTHWHNVRLLKQKKVAPLGFHAHKRKQRLAAEIIAYAASLTGAQGKVIDRESIVASDSTAVKANIAVNKHEKQPKQLVKKGGKSKHGVGGKQAALDAAQAVADTAARAKEATLAQSWKARCAVFDKESDPLVRYIKAKAFLAATPGATAQTVKGEVLLYLCNALISSWAKAFKKDSPRRDLYLVGLVWQHMLEAGLLRSSTKEVSKGFKALEDRLGLPSTGMACDNAMSRPLAFSFLPSPVPKLPLSSTDFQLGLCGPYLERSFNSRPDKRVAFDPDEWQCKVLDAIDADKSILVVAPTSAGKTFISFYAMKKILQSSDDDILVYLAPTKALVNQIAAEVEARFSKVYQREGKCLWAVKTRDYTINSPDLCQILITVPQMLSVLLLSPVNAQKPNSWSRRIKRIIFDEVHCIGQAEDGIVWEQMLLLAPCPIIALSATIGNIVEMRDWMASIQQKQGYQLDLIVHDVRYSDLRKFVYHPPEHMEFSGLSAAISNLGVPGLDEGRETNARFIHIHPVGAIVDRTRQSLDDVALEPRDAVALWEVMRDAQTSEFPVDSALAPRTFLPAIVQKSDFILWEKKLKDNLCTWMARPDSPFERVRSKLRTIHSPLKDSQSTDSNIKSDNSLLYLLCDLHRQSALPALVFSFDRGVCEDVVLRVRAGLVKAEDEYKKGQEWQSKMGQFAKWQKASLAASTAASKADRKSGKRKGDDKDEGADNLSRMDRQRDEAGEQSAWDHFDPEAPLEQFSFANAKKLTPSEFSDILKSFRYESVQAHWIDALRRGLGVHHAGMNRRYRTVVEMLFRRGYLRVVVATGTLALGINMPCKTVVFEGDTVFLTALSYRQASGRAGRRGFDLLGNVVFNGISTARVHELVSSQLPDLNGQFAISTSLLLRLFALLHETDSGEFAARSTHALLGQTRLYLGGPQAEMAIKHHVRFSIEYLRRQQLLSATGAPINFSGIVSHLYYAENAAFGWHALLKGGYLHELCADIDSREQATLLELVLVMAHLFQRHHVTRFNYGQLKQAAHRSPSTIFLPPLPVRAETLLLQHNAQLLETFQAYVHSYVTQNLADSDRSLPLSRVLVGAEQDSGLGAFEHNRRPPVLRSPFIALSGRGDEFESIAELCHDVRSGVFLEESALPYVPIWPHDLDMPLNAYLYDFFKHGSLEVLVRDNKIHRGEVWFRLRDFSLVLATIVTALTNLMTASAADPDDVVGDGSDTEVMRDQRPADDDADLAEIDGLTLQGDDEEVDGGSGFGTGGGGLEKVLKAFTLLQAEFDKTFLKIWA